MADQDNTGGILDQLNAQDEVASMMNDQEVQDQLDEIEEAQRIELGESQKEAQQQQQQQQVDTNGSKAPEVKEQRSAQGEDQAEVQMSMAYVKQSSASKEGKDLEDLLQDDSDGEGVVMEESFEFDPGQAMSSHGAATGFDAEFTETVVIEKAKEEETKVASSAPRVNTLQQQQQKPNRLAASSRELLMGLGNADDEVVSQQHKSHGLQNRGQNRGQGGDLGDTLFDKSMMTQVVKQELENQEAIEDMSIIQGNETQFMNQTEMDLFDERPAQLSKQQSHPNPQLIQKPEPLSQVNQNNPIAASGRMSESNQQYVAPAQRHQIATNFANQRAEYADKLIQNANTNQNGQFVTIRGYLHSDELARHFDVVSYTKMKDHFEYVIDGIDPATMQAYQIKRRYKHFLALRNCFVERLPGLYIPALPKKQSFGSGSEEFLKERCYLLSMFIKQVAKCPYLVESEEFQVFVFPQQDIDKQLSWLHEKNFNPKATLDRFLKYFQIHGTIKESEMTKAFNEIMKFMSTCKRMQSFLTKFIDYITIMQKKYEENNARASSLNKFLYDYELHSVLTYSPKINTYLGSKENLPEKNQLPEEQLLFQNNENQALKQDFDNLPRTLTNPFVNVKMWLKYEILEIEAILETIEKRAELEKRRNQRHTKRIDDLKELNNLQNDKFMIGSIFMSKDQIQKRIVELKKSIENCESQLHDYENLAKLATMSLVKNTIPFFKTCKFQTYYQSVNQFTATEIDNCEQTINLFQRVIGLNQSLIQKDVHHWEQHDKLESSRIISFNQGVAGQQ